MKKLTLITAIVLTANITFAQIINIPADYTTIQQGINASHDGDTVLVSPGTYVENLKFYGKNITLASHYLITLDTAYISQTIIDGNQSGCVVAMDAGILNGFIITNGFADCENGGGIHCYGTGIQLINLIVSKNSAQGGIGYSANGGGIYCSDSTFVQNVTVINNSTNRYGGGIFVGGMIPSSLQDIVIANNEAGYGGGGICLGNTSSLENVIIENNTATEGAYALGTGGGMYLQNSNPILKQVTIRNNLAYAKGGGVYFENSNPIFDSVERCNIYMNSAWEEGFDIYSNSAINIVVDTFTVLNPTSYLAAPLSNFTFDISNGHIIQVDVDVFVSSTGNNSNSGLSATEPIKNIQYAVRKVLADSLNPHTIQLLEGTYSPSTNDEWFPVILPDYVSLSGSDQHKVILDAEKSAQVIRIKNRLGIIISDLTISGGNARDGGGGLVCWNSNPVLQNLSINNNESKLWGGGLYLSSSNPVLNNLTISNNIVHNDSSYFLYYGSGSGIYCMSSNPVIQRGTIRNNISEGYGGGISFINSIPVFDSVNRCSIYSNQAILGKDLFFYSEQIVEVYLDTFSVLQPTGYYIHPLPMFDMHIWHGLIPQIAADVYVSPLGNNENSGLTLDDPFKNIGYALSRIVASSENPHTIFLSNGIFAPSVNNENFPLVFPGHINLKGESEDGVVLDAEGLSGVLEFQDCPYSEISNLTVKGGYRITSSEVSGAGIAMKNSGIFINHVTIAENLCENFYYGGGGIWCNGSSSSIFKNITVKNNTSSGPGGGLGCWGGAPLLENVIISGNSVTSWKGGGGMYLYNSSPTLKNCLLSGNTSNGNGGGLSCNNNSNPLLINVTISGNIASEYNFDGGVYCSGGSNPEIINTILWDNEPQEISLRGYGSTDTNSISISYSNIKGGLSGIQTNNNGAVNWLEGNIDEDPLFMDGWEHPYAISKESPCKDAGTPDTTGFFLPVNDLVGGPRIWNNRIDMGAYEWNNVGVEDPQALISDLRMRTYPNPFTDKLMIEFEQLQPGNITLAILNSLGQQAAVLFSGYKQAGTYSIDFNGTGLSSGIYLCRLQAGDQSAVIRLIKL